MNARVMTVAALLLAAAGVASAHRLDEYLQAILISVDKEHVQGSMRLIPGVSVASSVIANIDTNNDGVISRSEERAYAERVLADLSLRIDDKGLKPSELRMLGT